MPREWIVSEEDLGCDGAYFSYKEVVRCKDCKFMEIEPSGKYWVARCPIRKQILNPRGFCESGERRE